MSMSMPMRVLGRTGARELTAEELNQVSGSNGTRIAVKSAIPPVIDGVITD